MSKWSYAILDVQNNRLSLKEVLESRGERLLLVRYFEKEDVVYSRVVTSFDAADYEGIHSLRNVECYHLCSRILGHDGAIRTAESLMMILGQLREHSTVDPAGALASLREGDMNTILSSISARLRDPSLIAA